MFKNNFRRGYRELEFGYFYDRELGSKGYGWEGDFLLYFLVFFEF